VTTLTNIWSCGRSARFQAIPAPNSSQLCHCRIITRDVAGNLHCFIRGRGRAAAAQYTRHREICAQYSEQLAIAPETGEEARGDSDHDQAAEDH
jgi:hypothetical protein